MAISRTIQFIFTAVADFRIHVSGKRGRTTPQTTSGTISIQFLRLFIVTIYVRTVSIIKNYQTVMLAKLWCTQRRTDKIIIKILRIIYRQCLITFFIQIKFHPYRIFPPRPGFRKKLIKKCTGIRIIIKIPEIPDMNPLPTHPVSVIL